MKRFLIHIFAMTLLASCTKGFTTDERKIIYGGEEEIMRVLKCKIIEEKFTGTLGVNQGVNNQESNNVNKKI